MCRVKSAVVELAGERIRVVMLSGMIEMRSLLERQQIGRVRARCEIVQTGPQRERD